MLLARNLTFRQKDNRARDFKFAVANEIAQECYCNLYLLSVLKNYTLSSFLSNVAVWISTLFYHKSTDHITTKEKEKQATRHYNQWGIRQKRSVESKNHSLPRKRHLKYIQIFITSCFPVYNDNLCFCIPEGILNRFSYSLCTDPYAVFTCLPYHPCETEMYWLSRSVSPSVESESNESNATVNHD